MKKFRLVKTGVSKQSFTTRKSATKFARRHGYRTYKPRRDYRPVKVMRIKKISK